MTIILTEAEYDELLEAEKFQGIARRTIFENDGEKIIHRHNMYIQNGCNRTLELRQGVKLRIWSFESRQDLVVQCNVRSHQPLMLSFFYHGRHAHSFTRSDAAG